MKVTTVHIVTVAAGIAIAGIIVGLIEARNQTLDLMDEWRTENEEWVNQLTEEAKTRCHEPNFYNGNFERCERLNIRP